MNTNTISFNSKKLIPVKTFNYKPIEQNDNSIFNKKVAKTNNTAITKDSAIISSSTNSEYKPDSEDDKNGSIETSKQRGTGNCWLLSGVNALSYTQEGKKLIKEALEYQNGQTVVHLKGIGDYTVTDAELADARKQIDSKEAQYSSGDDDMLILELAIEKMLDDFANNKILLSKDAPHLIFENLYYKDATSENNSSTESGRSGVIFNLLSGKKPELTEDPQEINEALDKFQENNGKDFVMSASGKINAIGNASFKLKDGSTIELPLRHAYAVKNVTDDTVTIVNPWDSSKEIEISKSDFCNTFMIQTCDLSENGENLDCFDYTSEYTDKELTKEQAKALEELDEYDRYCAVEIFESNPKASAATVSYILDLDVQKLKYITESSSPETSLKNLEENLGNHDLSSDKTWYLARDYKELGNWLKKAQQDLGDTGLERIANRNLLYNPYISRDLSAYDIYVLSFISDDDWEQAMQLMEENPKMSTSEIYEKLKN